MRLKLLCTGILGLAATALAQTSAAPELHLRGGRFRPLVYEQMTAEQKVMTDDVLKGERGSMNGPYNILLRSPEMGDLAQKYGAYLRFHSSVSKKLNEFAILITARHRNSQYEWYAHHKYGIQAGLNPALIDALAAGKRPSPMEPDEQIVYSFCLRGHFKTGHTGSLQKRPWEGSGT
jgi:4-carboxymuconolactone decarboxylase